MWPGNICIRGTSVTHAQTYKQVSPQNKDLLEKERRLREKVKKSNARQRSHYHEASTAIDEMHVSNEALFSVEWRPFDRKTGRLQ